jgi:hypothetical protein
VPDLASVVDCRTAHAYEVYDVIDVPEAALTGSSRKERIANRDDLALPSELQDDSTQRQAFEAFAELECGTSLQRVVGFGDLELGGKGAEDARILPVLRGVNALTYSVMPEKEWLAGRRKVVCSARFEEPEHTGPGRTPVQKQASSDDAMILTKVSDDALPVEFRLCRTYDQERREVAATSCAGPHVDEVLFYFEAGGVFDEEFISSIEKQPTPKKFNRFDKVCADAFTQLLGPDYDAKALRGFGGVARRWTERSKPVRCSVGAVDFRTTDLGPGSLVGTGAEKVELIRAK